MKIGIDSSFVNCNIGFGRYSYNLIKELLKIDKNEYLLLSNKLPERISLYKNIVNKTLENDLHNHANVQYINTDYKIRFYWSKIPLQKFLRKKKIEIFHSIDNVTGPLKKKIINLF